MTKHQLVRRKTERFINVFSGPNINNGTPSSQSRLCWEQYIRNIDFRVLWKRSSAPWVYGWYALDLPWCTPNLAIVCENRFEQKFTPRSDCNSTGYPKIVKNLCRASIIFRVLIFLNAIASTYRVEAHILVNKYSLPDLVLGKGPTQSITMRAKGSPNAGIGLRWALSGFWFGLPTIWHTWHDWQ